MINSDKSRNVIVFVLVLSAMMLTRLPVFDPALHLADVSWAAFFVAGFYLAGQWRWAFPSLMAVAVLCDVLATQWMGVSNYCLTVAYWFLVPGYGCLWLGGQWFHRHRTSNAKGACLLGLSLLISASACYLISNASFYWLGDRVSLPTWTGWINNVAAWYWPFVRVPFIHVSVIAAIHLIILQLRDSPVAQGSKADAA